MTFDLRLHCRFARKPLLFTRHSYITPRSFRLHSYRTFDEHVYQNADKFSCYRSTRSQTPLHPLSHPRRQNSNSSIRKPTQHPMAKITRCGISYIRLRTRECITNTERMPTNPGSSAKAVRLESLLYRCCKRGRRKLPRVRFGLRLICELLPSYFSVSV
jgi:hypothetical protein